MAQGKTNIKVLRIDSRIISRAGYLWMLGILLSIVPVFAAHTAIDPGLVFCPLQKTWVKKGSQSKAAAADPLKDICASDAAKQKFSYESFRHLNTTNTVLDDSRTQELFFDYTRSGRRAFGAVRPGHTPEQSLSGRRGSEKSVANGTIVSLGNEEPASAPGLPLLVVIERAKTFFERPHIYESGARSRDSRPRAPPFL